MLLGNHSSPSRRVPRVGLNFEIAPPIDIEKTNQLVSLLKT